MVRVFIVDKHAVVRDALKKRLSTAVGFEIVGCTGDYDQAHEVAQSLTPDVILLETKDEKGLDTLNALLSALPHCSVVVLTSYSDSREQDQAMEIGAKSYLLKSLDTPTLIREIRRLSRASSPTNNAQMATRI